MSWWLFGIVMVIAGIFRFVNFSNRWVLNQDQARDAVIGIYGSRNGLWPEIGSPSSAGPFNFGPWYHWLIMVWQKIIPTVDGPWIGFSLMTLMTVILLGLVGKKYFGNKGLFIFGLMAAVAVGQVENAPDMLNTVIVGFFSALALWSGSKFVDEDKWRWGVLCGLSVGWAINSHFQSWGLLSLPLAIAVVNKYSLLRRLKMGLTMATGWILAFLPLIWFDVKHNWIWIKSVIEYYTVGVNKFYVPVRWLTEIRDFWPQLFGAVTVGENWFGYIWMGLGMILVIKLLIKSYQSKKYKVNKFWIILVLSLLIQVLLMRMYKGVRSREYLIVFHGYIC